MSFSLRLSQDHDGRRLDRTLRSVWPELPLSAIMRAIRKGEVIRTMPEAELLPALEAELQRIRAERR